jgi:hypothetical protein
MKGTIMPRHLHAERARDRTLEDSFPASDPPGVSGITGVGQPDRPSHARPMDERPTGTPTSDRHATETAHQWEYEEKPRAKR